MAWLSGWTKRVKLTVDNTKVDSTLSHFPVTVFLSSTHGDCVFDELASDANRKKIAVTKSDGTTQLYGEIEKWDDANESAILHVSGSGWSISSSADTDFYLYYLSTQSENTTYIGDINSTPGASVWNSNDKMVQHMVDDTTSTILDSTSNSNDGTKASANNPLEAVGKVGKGQDFDGGTSDKIDIAAAVSINALGDFTFLAAVNFPALGSDYTFVFNDKYNGNNLSFWRFNDRLYCKLFNTNYMSTIDISAGDHLIIATRSGTTLKLYLDGAFLNSFTVSSTALASSGYLIGKWYSGTSYTFDGVISEARIINTGHTLAWVKATYNSLWDTLLTYGSEETPGAVSINKSWELPYDLVYNYLNQQYELPYDSVEPFYTDFEEPYDDRWLSQDFDEPYENTLCISSSWEEIWSFPIHQSVEEPWDILFPAIPRSYVVEYYRDRANPQIERVEWYENALLPFLQMEIPYENIPFSSKSFVESYSGYIDINTSFDFSYTLLTQPIIAISEPYAICEANIRKDAELVYKLNDKDPAYSEYSEFYSILSGISEITDFDISVVVDETIIEVLSISIQGSLNSYALTLSMNVSSISDYQVCSYGKIATISIGSESFKFFLEGKNRSRSHGESIYSVSGTSLNCQLDKPKSDTILKSWDTAITAKAVIEEVASDYIDAVTHSNWYEPENWLIPANVLFANDESPLEIVRKIARTSGGVIQPYKDGTLRIRKRFPVSVPNWNTTAADFILTDEDNTFSSSENFEFRSGENKVLVSNQDVSNSDRIRIDEVEINSLEKKLLCYVTPYNENFELLTSKNDVTIELMGTVEETITETIEIVEGSGTVSKPIYSENTAAREYLDTQLGAVTFYENGNLTTEISGQSLLSITYTTKYREYIVRSSNLGQAQFYTVNT